MRFVVCVAVAAVVVLLASMIVGQRAAAEPWDNLEPVSTFSLGSAESKLPALPHRPSPDALYRQVVAYYDRFDAAAASVQQEFTGYDTSNKTKEVLTSGKTHCYGGEWRMAKPDKNLEVMLSDGRPVIVCAQYGRKRWSYGVKRNEFMDADFIVDVTRQRSAVPDWLHLRVGPKWGPRFSLAKDEQVGDTDCYVLVIRGTPIVTPKPKPGSFEEIKAYLGKSDLLPRRVEQRSLIIMKDVTEHELTVTKITGFVANPSLPADIFPTGPPKGAKRQ